MSYLDIMSPLHKSTTRDYLARVNDPDFPKAKAASIAKRWGYDYWDGDRRINYGGYKYIPGRWAPVAKNLAEHYKLSPKSTVLDVGCGKGFLMYELMLLLPGITVLGLDISDYAITCAHEGVKGKIAHGTAARLPYADKAFDLALSINTLHNLSNRDLEAALREIQRTSRDQYICVESYRDEVEKANLLYWQVTCEQFNSPDDWKWWFEKTGYSGDYSFIYFE